MTDEAGFDTTLPAIARVYDVLLGGKDNFAADRAAAATLREAVPDVTRSAAENRAALGRGVRYLAAAGADQFLEIGSGMPARTSTHQIAQELNPLAKVVYADSDPVVVAHGRALRAVDARTAVVETDLADPASIVGHPDIRTKLDFSRPVAVLLVGLHSYFLGDTEPADWTSAVMAELAPGSHLFLTDLADTGEPLQRALAQASRKGLGFAWSRTPEQFERAFLGMPLIPPGIAHPARWFPGEPGTPGPVTLASYQRLLLTGMARKP